MVFYVAPLSFLHWICEFSYFAKHMSIQMSSSEKRQQQVEQVEPNLVDRLWPSLNESLIP